MAARQVSDTVIVKCKIHPAIGIGRVGNSPQEFFIGPEVPGVLFPPSGGYKDTGAFDAFIPPRLKRQAARFRIFGYNAAGEWIKEITGPEMGTDLNVAWTVHLANKKAAWHEFKGLAGEDSAHPAAPLRNKKIEGTARDRLVIDPGPRDLTGKNQRALFDSGSFLGISVPLGEIHTEDTGRLIVLGGYGKSGTADTTRRIGNYANNDYWHDDVSDGPVAAHVIIGGTEIPVVPAWVVIGPPDFAPALTNVVTLYDVVFEAQLAKTQLTLPDRPSFTKHIYPILSRTVGLQWVNKTALAGHGGQVGIKQPQGFDFTARLKELASNDPAQKPLRRSVVAAVRDPNADPIGSTAQKQANGRFMPPLSGDSGDALTWPDDYDNRPFIPHKWLTLTKTQFGILQKWADGNFDSDWPEQLEPAGHIQLAFSAGRKPTIPQESQESLLNEVSPVDLDRAALEAAIGGAFYPGIESGWVMRNPSTYMDTEPGRLDVGKLQAGDITKRMACPWQADFFECNTYWWPAQRPDDVLTLETYRTIIDLDSQLAQLDKNDPNYNALLETLMRQRTVAWSSRSLWSRGLPQDSYAGDEAMVDNWHHLGLVVTQSADGEQFVLDSVPQFVETERYPYVLSMAESFHILMNIRKNPAFLPRAKELALAMLADAKFSSMDNYNQFYYTPEAFDERMKKIYHDFVNAYWIHGPDKAPKPHSFDTGDISWKAVVDYDADGEPVKATRRYNVKKFSDKAVKERIKQLAPFNLVDGAWLQNIAASGPIDEIHARLFSIWSDEAGNGKTELNHCNVYQTLLRSLNIYLPPTNSREFIEQDFVPSAFDGSVFQLCVGEFPQDFLPELLGMTLYLEWEATPTLSATVQMLNDRHIDPHFYKMHVAIDNISAGHGALAKEAVKLYLEAKRQEGGDQAVQEHWERIWRGYVAWATLGNSADEVLERMMILDRKQIFIQSSLVSEWDLRTAFILRARDSSDAVSKFVRAALSPSTIPLLRAYTGGIPEQDLRTALQKDINALLKGPSIYDEARFAGVQLSEPTKALLAANPQGIDLIDLNRWLLEDAYPEPQGVARKTPFPDLKGYYGARMIELVRRKAPIASQMHWRINVPDPVTPGKTITLNDLFDRPEDLLRVLLDRGYIDINHPRNSHLFDFVDFSGPMYKVFSDDDKAVILDWIESLRPDVPVSIPVPNPVYPADPAAAMLQVIEKYQSRARQTPRHEDYFLMTPTGRQSVRACFQGSARDVLVGVAGSPEWVKPGDPDHSPLLTDAVASYMSRVFAEDEVQVIRNWIKDGAKIPKQPVEFRLELAETAAAPPIQLITIPQKFGFAERRSHVGMGSVH